MDRIVEKGFSYYLEDEKLLEYSKLTAEDKLKWLAEVNEFTRLAQSKESVKIGQNFEAKDFKKRRL
ncbi:MAG TPA: hypothetical protein VNJ07_06840 [Chitinophagales bacterium]|nr:hypothetical protein [Chitinophagales bacterium]